MTINDAYKTGYSHGINEGPIDRKIADRKDGTGAAYMDGYNDGKSQARNL